jgi:transposase
MASGRASCSGCQERDREILHLRRRLALLNQEHQSLQRENERLVRRMAKVERQNRELRQRLDEARREQHRQAHPFRREKTQPGKPKKPGRRKGHPPALRPAPTPEQIDRVINVPLHECPTCHVPLCDPEVVVQYQTDLPPIVPIVTRFNIQTGFCPCCRQHWQGRHPEQTSDACGAAGNTLGPVVLTMAAEMKNRLGVSYRKIADFLATYAGLHAAPATFVRAEQRLAVLARPTYALLLEALRQSHVVHADETGWRIGRLNAWLWVFSSTEATIYVVRSGKGARGHQVPEDVLGPDFDGYLVVDGLKSYDVLEVAKGRCNGHLLRRCKDLHDIVPGKEQRYLASLSSLLQEAIDLARRREALTPAGYARRVQEIENRLDDWLDGLPRSVSPELDRLDSHIRAHRGEWLVFLHDPAVPPTNNHAEQMLRPAVITRKVGGCNKTLWGALVHGVLASLMVSCQRQGRRFLDLARRLWQSSDPPAVPLEALPGGRAGNSLDGRGPETGRPGSSSCCQAPP